MEAAPDFPTSIMVRPPVTVAEWKHTLAAVQAHMPGSVQDLAEAIDTVLQLVIGVSGVHEGPLRRVLDRFFKRGSPKVVAAVLQRLQDLTLEREGHWGLLQESLPAEPKEVIYVPHVHPHGDTTVVTDDGVRHRLLQLVDLMLATHDEWTDARITLQPLYAQLKTSLPYLYREFPVLELVADWRLGKDMGTQIGGMLLHDAVSNEWSGNTVVNQSLCAELDAVVATAEALPWVSASAKARTVSWLRELSSIPRAVMADHAWLVDARAMLVHALPDLRDVFPDLSIVVLQEVPAETAFKVRTWVFDSAMRADAPTATDARREVQALATRPVPPNCSLLLQGMVTALDQAEAWKPVAAALAGAGLPHQEPLINNERGCLVLSPDAERHANKAEEWRNQIPPALRAYVADCLTEVRIAPTVEAEANVRAIVHGAETLQQAVTRLALPAVVKPLGRGLHLVLKAILDMVKHSREHTALEIAVHEALAPYAVPGLVIIRDLMKFISKLEGLDNHAWSYLTIAHFRFRHAVRELPLHELLLVKKALRKLAAIMDSHRLSGLPTYAEEAQPILARLWQWLQSALEVQYDARMSPARVGWMTAVAQAAHDQAFARAAAKRFKGPSGS